MKLPLLPSFFALVLAALWLPTESRADTSSPMFAGSMLDIHGNTYDWSYAEEDGTWHYDYYNGPYGSVTVTGMIGFPNLASVSGASDGHLQNSMYGDNYWESGTPGYGYWESRQYTVDLALGELYWIHHTSDNDYWTGSWSSSWGDSRGEWGSSSYSNSNDYNGNQSWSESWDGSNGVSGWRNGSSSNYNDGMGNSSWSESWDSSDGVSGWRNGSSSNYNDYNGNQSWSESWDSSDGVSGWRNGGSSQSISPGSDVSLFGMTFTWSSEGSSWEQSSNGTNYGSGYTNYSTGDGSLQVSYEYNNQAGTAFTSIYGWTPEIGSFSASLPNTSGVSDWSAVGWDARAAPTFAPHDFWVNGWLVSWQSGTLNSSGIVEDVYGGAGGLLEVRCVGDVREFVQGNQTAEVHIQGTTVGSIDHNTQFAVSGWTVATTGADQPSTTPYFLPDASSLLVDGAGYAFLEGYSDANGGHVDVYELGGTGTLRLVGNSPGTAHVAGNNLTTFFHGSLSGGYFEVTGAVLSAELSQALPAALWVRGGLFLQDSQSVGTYHWWPADASEPFSLAVTRVNEGFQISGSDDLGSIFGIVPNSGGLYFIHAGADATAPLTVSVIQATATGQPLASGEDMSAYPSHPLAVEVAGRIFTFVSTVNGGAAAAYLPVDLRTERRRVEIDLSTGISTLTDHAVEPPLVKSGKYDPATWLFSTTTGTAALPEFLHAVQQGNNTHLRLPLPEGSVLPNSFIVRGKPWWFAGWNEVTNAATYRGFYDGQVMTVGNAVPPVGSPAEHLVTLIDRPNNGVNNQGGDLITQEVRRSVLRRDGTLMLSSTELGGQQTIAQQINHQQQTIAADLDLMGNNLSFGILEGDASLAGALFQFTDLGGTATLHSTLSRPQAQWVWNRAAFTGAQTTLPVMKLEYDGSLHLYAADHATGGPSIVLTPNSSGTSRISSQLEVSEDVQLLNDLSVGGDLNVAGAINGDLDVQGNLAVSGSITSNGAALLTQTFADTRYLRSDAVEPLAIANGVHITGATQLNGALSATDAVTMDGGATITGATQLNGTLTATGNITANAAARYKGDVVMESGVMVRGVYDGPPEDNKVIMQAGQNLLIPESGDISMGVFRAGPLPETVPAP